MNPSAKEESNKETQGVTSRRGRQALNTRSATTLIVAYKLDRYKSVAANHHWRRKSRKRSASLDHYGEVPPFPLPAILPEKSEGNPPSADQRFGGQIEILKISSTLFRISIAARLPIVEAPTHHRRFRHKNA